MKVVIEDEEQKQKNLKIFYITIVAICVIAVFVALGVQIVQHYKTSNAKDNIGRSDMDSSELTGDKSTTKEKFINIFKNKVNYLKNNAYKINRIKEDEEIVYVSYKNNESKVNDYELDVNIPCINIKSKTAEEMNTQIREIFETKAKNVLNSQKNNIIYTVSYSAYISNNILSLVVRSTLKEGANPQRDIVQTYNYNLTDHSKCTIDYFLDQKGITKKEANQKIKDEISNIQKRTEELANLGYTVYQRDYTSDFYNINNVTEYFMGEDNQLYIIFAYGNDNHTSEMDIVIM